LNPLPAMTGIVAEELLVRDAGHWRAWLETHHDSSPGVWLVLPKKETVEPTSLNHDQALEVALCHGWIDGQLGRRDSATYYQRFGRRRPRSAWSKRNIGIAERLLLEGPLVEGGYASDHFGREEALSLRLTSDRRDGLQRDGLQPTNAVASLSAVAAVSCASVSARPAGRVKQVAPMLAAQRVAHGVAPTPDAAPSW
jgi:hypothetical protein